MAFAKRLGVVGFCLLFVALMLAIGACLGVEGTSLLSSGFVLGVALK